MKKKCPKCSSDNRAAAKFCRYCGSRIPERYPQEEEIKSMANPNIDQMYEEVKKHRQTLLAIIAEQVQVLQSLGMTGRVESIRQLEERVKSDTFKILVVGEFKTGKSAFINALLHKEILPSYSLPCTAIINEVKWGDNPRARLHFKTSERVRPPLEIPADQLERYVTIQDFDNKNEETHQNAYSHVELFWPLDLCRHDVEIIDSPGLNENPHREEITLNYLKTVDAVLFVMTCTKLGPSISEERSIETIRQSGHEEIFFILNQFDAIRRKEQAGVRQHGLSEFAPLTNRGQNGLFFISALHALEARLGRKLDDDRPLKPEEAKKMLEQSNVPKLENALATFLTKDRGRIKILRPITTLRGAIREARNTIPERESLLKDDLGTLERKVAKAEKSLQKLDIQRQQIVNQIERFRADIRWQVSIKAQKFYGNLTVQIPAWLKAYKIQVPVRIWRLKMPQKQIENVLNEVTQYVVKQIESEFATWQRQELQPFLDLNLESLKRDLDRRAHQFVKQVDDLRFNLTQSEVRTRAEEIENISALERVLAAAGGFIMGDIVSAGIGATFGTKEMLKSVAQQLALALATTLLIGWNPAVLIPVLLSGGLIQGAFKMGATNERIKEVIGQKFTDELSQTNSQRANEVAHSVWQALSTIQDPVDQGLRQEIRGVRDQLDSTLAEKRKGEANVNRKLTELKQLRRQLDQIEEKVEVLVSEV